MKTLCHGVFYFPVLNDLNVSMLQYGCYFRMMRFLCILNDVMLIDLFMNECNVAI